VLGVLGAYLVMVLVLAVSVETILEPFTWWFSRLAEAGQPGRCSEGYKNWLPRSAGHGTLRGGHRQPEQGISVI